MAYEYATYELILSDMLTRISAQYPNLDTREGSLIYTAVASAALEIAISYIELDNVLKESFVETASREYLVMSCNEAGMDTSVFDANAGVFKGEFDVEVPIGSRWNCDIYNYTVAELIGKNTDTQYYEYKMLCETLGTAPNEVIGSLSAITTLPSKLSHAELTECLIEGENEYTDDEIRTAYINFVRNDNVDGNVAQYKQWCDDYEGIGAYKIFPLWKGDNTVKVSILNASNRAASTEPGGLVETFQKYLDPGITGMGDGQAPIGAFVTVSTATEIPINITCNVTLKETYTSTPDIDGAITNYFKSIAYDKSQVSYLSVGAAILAVDGIDSISDLIVNNGTADIALQAEEIPVLGTTTWTVVKAVS